MMFILLIALYVTVLSMTNDKVGARNVGTVLFTGDDVQSGNWNRDTLALLKARMYFQQIVPPFSFPRSDVPEYVSTLLKYICKSYATIRKESKDNETNRILTDAFTDVIGGYLKMFALPIAKFAYYGGTLPKDEALKLFIFYEDSKRHLHSNGSSWADPDVALLNSITINVASAPFTSLRGMTNQDPCGYLSYFEKTPTGLTIPTPRIDWSSCTMFIPLANYSFINLYSPKVSTALHKYYDIATNCVRHKRPSSLNVFNERFQSWLQGDVVPHLNDDDLYPALQGILSLVNSTTSIAPYSVLNNVMNQINNDADQLGLDIHVTSKKMAIAIVTLLLGLMWCIPTSLYLLCKNSEKGKSRRTSKTSSIYRGHRSDEGLLSSTGTVFSPRWRMRKKRGGLKLTQKPFTMMEVGECYSSLSLTSIMTQTKESRFLPPSADVATMVDETSIPKKHKTIMKDTETQHEYQALIPRVKSIEGPSHDAWTKQQSSDDTGKTVTLSTRSPSKNTTIKIASRSIKKTTHNNSSKVTKDTIDTVSAPPATKITDEMKTGTNVVMTETTKNKASLKYEFSATVGVVPPCNDKNVLVQKSKRINKAKGLKIETEDNAIKFKVDDKPYLQIRIDRPKQGINVGILRKEERKDIVPKLDKVTKEVAPKADNKAKEVTPKADNTAKEVVPNTNNNEKEVEPIAENRTKQAVPKTDTIVSKIPKRTTSPQTDPCAVTRMNATGTSPRFNVPKDGTKYRKSMIPKLKRAQDDSALKRDKNTKADKLNVTL